MASRIPPLLEPYLRLPPEASLLLLTGLLGASTNWLIQRYLTSFLVCPGQVTSPGDAQAGTQPEDVPSIVLASFLRDYAFWKDGAARNGVDLDAYTRNGRFRFVDGLGGLFNGTSSSQPGHSANTPSQSRGGQSRLCTPTALGLRSVLNTVVDELQRQRPGVKIVLILDSPDLLLAASGGSVSGEALNEVLLDVREKIHSSVVTIAADQPLISTQITSLEKDHAAFALSLAHEAQNIISLRLLDTGTARDVSGVLRVTNGGISAEAPLEERELLYFVSGDGGIRVFERGQ